MKSGYALCGLLIYALISWGHTRAADLGTPIDLSAFADPDERKSQDSQETSDQAEVLPVSLHTPGASPQFYVAGIVGASFATLQNGGSNPFLLAPGTSIGSAGSVNGPLFTGGGAAGVAFSRSSGALRMEIEGRDRGQLSGETYLTVTSEAQRAPMTTTASGAWSVMTNFWRDFYLTDAFGIYGGGGIGFGGYQYSLNNSGLPGSAVAGAEAVSTYAWQIGTGATYRASNRVTFDVGYRFFSYGVGSTPLEVQTSTFALNLGNYSSAFTASEVLLSVRIYEPFRNWRE